MPRDYSAEQLLTETADAQRFVADHEDQVLYCHDKKEWLVYTGTHWEPNRTGRVERLAAESVRQHWGDIRALEEQGHKQTETHLRRAASERGINATLALARKEPKIQVAAGDLDCDPHLLNVANGTLDLRRGTLRPHDRADRITHCLPVTYRPDAPAPTWHAALQQWFPDPEQRSYVQRAVGYSLTGSMKEQKLFMVVGRGENGKSSFLGAIRDVFGSYAASSSDVSFTSRSRGKIREDLYRLRGKRAVFTTEWDRLDRLDETLIKSVTGGEKVVARQLYGETVEFKPTAKLWIVMNDLPRLTQTDYGLWRRLAIIRMDQRLKQIDRDLDSKLAGEAAGILAWAVEGAVLWSRQGLGTCPAVEAAGCAHRRASDPVGCFLEERCIVAADARVSAPDLYRIFRQWCSEHNVEVLNVNTFGRRLKEKGLPDSMPVQGVRWRKGVALLPDLGGERGEDAPARSDVNDEWVGDGEMVPLPDFPDGEEQFEPAPTFSELAQSVPWDALTDGVQPPHACQRNAHVVLAGAENNTVEDAPEDPWAAL